MPSLTEVAGREQIDAFFAAFLEDGPGGPPRIVEAPGHTFSDAKRKPNSATYCKRNSGITTWAFARRLLPAGRSEKAICGFRCKRAYPGAQREPPAPKARGTKMVPFDMSRSVD